MERGHKNTVLLIATLGVVTFFGGYVLLNAGGANSTELQQKVAAAKKIGMPIEMKDLDIRPVPIAKNAAFIYSQADQLIKSYPDQEKALIGSESSQDWWNEVDSDMAIIYLQPYFQLLDKVDSYPDCYFPRDWTPGENVTFPEFTGLRRDVRDLCIEADWEDRMGQTQAALKTMDRASRISTHAASDPVLIGILVQCSTQIILDKEWQSLLLRHSQDSKFLATAAERIKAETQLPDIRRCVSTEIILGRQTFGKISSIADLGVSPNETSLFQRELLRSQMVRHAYETRFMDTWLSVWPKLPADTHDWDGAHQVFADMQANLQKDTSMASSINEMLMPGYPDAMNTIGIVQAREHLLETTIALFRAKNKTGKFPAILPSIGDMSFDPFDRGARLRYRPDAAGFVLYSVGSDRIDSGGISQDSNNPNHDGSDEVIQFGNLEGEPYLTS